MKTTFYTWAVLRLRNLNADMSNMWKPLIQNLELLYSMRYSNRQQTICCILLYICWYWAWDDCLHHVTELSVSPFIWDKAVVVTVYRPTATSLFTEEINISIQSEIQCPDFIYFFFSGSGKKGETGGETQEDGCRRRSVGRKKCWRVGIWCLLFAAFSPASDLPAL